LTTVGCTALGAGIGLIAAINLLVTIYFLRRKIRSRSTRFPTAEMASLGTLLGILTGQIFVRAKWLPIRDPACGQAYYVALLFLITVICYTSVRGLIRDCAISDAQGKRRR
jgi:hypothetical protein